MTLKLENSVFCPNSVMEYLYSIRQVICPFEKALTRALINESLMLPTLDLRVLDIVYVDLELTGETELLCTVVSIVYLTSSLLWWKMEKRPEEGHSTLQYNGNLVTQRLLQ